MSHEVEVDLHPQHLVEAEGIAWLIDPLGEAVEERPLRLGTPALASPERFTIPGDAEEGGWTVAAMGLLARGSRVRVPDGPLAPVAGL